MVTILETVMAVAIMYIIMRIEMIKKDLLHKALLSDLLTKHELEKKIPKKKELINEIMTTKMSPTDLPADFLKEVLEMGKSNKKVDGKSTYIG